MDIILASKSPRRFELLSMLGYEFTVNTTENTEPSPAIELSPEVNLQIITSAKGEAVAENNPDSAVIATDTVVFLNDVYYGKPKNEIDAERMLKELSGQTHKVFTGVSVYHARSGYYRFGCVCTNVTFKELTDEEILSYISTGEPLDKAGAYGVQGFGAKLIERVDGDFYNVMGLPVGLLRTMLFNLLGN